MRKTVSKHLKPQGDQTTWPWPRLDLIPKVDRTCRDNQIKAFVILTVVITCLYSSLFAQTLSCTWISVFYNELPSRHQNLQCSPMSTGDERHPVPFKTDFPHTSLFPLVDGYRMWMFLTHRPSLRITLTSCYVSALKWLRCLFEIIFATPLTRLKGDQRQRFVLHPSISGLLFISVQSMRIVTV